MEKKLKKITGNKKSWLFRKWFENKANYLRRYTPMLLRDPFRSKQLRQQNPVLMALTQLTDLHNSGKRKNTGRYFY
jgi:hypothetical protein